MQTHALDLLAESLVEALTVAITGLDEVPPYEIVPAAYAHISCLLIESPPKSLQQ